jgi:hypothetical protein
MGSNGDRAASLMLGEARSLYVGTYGFERMLQPSVRQFNTNDAFAPDALDTIRKGWR